MPSPLDPSHQAGPIVVTLLYVGVYYAFQLYVMRVKMRLEAVYRARDERFDRYFGQDREMLAADRIQLNMLEHMPPFLVLLWLTAVFVGPGPATLGGVIYLLARLGYPLAMGSRLGRGIPARIMLSTAPGYLVLAGFSAALLVTLLRGA